jgi:ferric-dicitrate binding protein FerR (iron transport regulator)
MPTIPKSFKKPVFNKEPNEPLTEEEQDTWNAFIAWEAFIEGDGNYYHPDLLKGTPLEHVPEVRSIKKPTKKDLADKVDFDNPVFIKALREYFIIEEIDRKVAEKLNEVIAAQQQTASLTVTEPDQTIVGLRGEEQYAAGTENQKKKISRTVVLKWVAVAAVLIFATFGIWYMLQPKMITITTRYGELRNDTLPDGTLVTLNARSSITYPKKFTGKIRNVELTGEAWFEVRHDKQHPFKVNAQGTTTTVTGTKFDIKAYAEDSAVIVSLKEGGVQVTNGDQLASLTPGQQAIVSGRHISKVDSVSFELLLDWRAKQIILEGRTLPSVLRQINRSYGVTIEVKGDLLKKMPPLDLTDTLETNRPLQNVVTTFNEASTEAKLTYDSTNHKLIVESKK